MIGLFHVCSTQGYRSLCVSYATETCVVQLSSMSFEKKHKFFDEAYQELIKISLLFCHMRLLLIHSCQITSTNVMSLSQPICNNKARFHQVAAPSPHEDQSLEAFLICSTPWPTSPPLVDSRQRISVIHQRFLSTYYVPSKVWVPETQQRTKQTEHLFAWTLYPSSGKTVN